VVRATRSTGELLGLQYAANNLGSAYLRGGRREEALAALEEARKVSVETGGSVVTVAIFGNLPARIVGVGSVTGSGMTRRFAAYDPFNEQGDRYHSALALDNLGEALTGAGRYCGGRGEIRACHGAAGRACVPTTAPSTCSSTWAG
jgi:tetratricopeptide (TPR) repeat protein